MMKLQEVFPNFKMSPAAAILEVEWEDDAFCEGVFMLLEGGMNTAQMHGGDIAGLCNGLVRNLVALKQSAPEHTQLFHVLQLRVGLTMMGIAAGTKQMPLLWAWTIRSIWDAEFEHVVELNPTERMQELTSLKRPVLQYLFDLTFPDWSRFFYYAASRFGAPFQELAIAIFEGTLRKGVTLLQVSEEAVSGANMVQFALNWAAVASAPKQGEATIELLYNLYRSEALPPDIQVRLGMIFATRVGETHGLNIAAEARFVREKYAEHLRGHEELQLLASELVSAIDQAPERKEEVLKAVETYKQYLGVNSPDNQLATLYDLGAILGAIEPMILKCFEAGHHQTACDILAAWKHSDGLQETVRDLLVCMPTYSGGVAYAGPKGFRSAGRSLKAAQACYRELVTAANRAFGDTHEIRHDPSFKLEVVDRIGVPDYEAGLKLEQVLREFYAPAELRDFVAESLSAASGLALFPYKDHPVAAVLCKEMGLALPYCCSWKTPKADRRVRRALIYAEGVQTAQFELGEITRLLRAVKVTCDVIPEGGEAKDSFVSKYSSEEYDLIWIIGHGEFEAYSPHQSHLSLFKGKLLLRDLTKMQVPATGRRLLVLNVCSGAAGAALGGLPDLGIGPLLASPDQAVVSHLWPVWMWAPVVFGSLLAGEIARSEQFCAAYSGTLQTLAGGPARINNRLAEQGSSRDLVERSIRLGDDWNNILNWGSSVFLQ